MQKGIYLDFFTIIKNKCHSRHKNVSYVIVTYVFVFLSNSCILQNTIHAFVLDTKTLPLNFGALKSVKKITNNDVIKASLIIKYRRIQWILTTCSTYKEAVWGVYEFENYFAEYTRVCSNTHRRGLQMLYPKWSRARILKLRTCKRPSNYDLFQAE